MDILLTHGHFLALDPAEQQVMRPYPPLGLLYLSAYLKRAGLEVEVFDSTFRQPAELERLLKERKPPAVGIYGNLLTRRNVLRIADTARALGATVILGGPEPASYAAQYLARGADFVVSGEGEETLLEVLRKLPEGKAAAGWSEVAGISYLSADGELVRTPPRALLGDLDSLPAPDREAIRLEDYLQTWRQHHGEGAVSLITSRGCPYTCTWCSHGVFGYSYRVRSPRHVADEMEMLRDRYRPDLLWFADDVFTMNRRWLREFTSEVLGRRLRIPFETITREDRIDEEIATLLGELGCRRIWVGAESGSQAVLDAMQRRTDAGRVAHVVDLLRRQGIQTGMFIMLGYEGEGPSELLQTADLLKQANPDLFLTTVAYPIQGTPYQQEVAARIVAPDSWERITDRELSIRGRPSARYYRHARRWLTSEMGLHRLRLQNRGTSLEGLRLRSSALLGRLGMSLSRKREPV